MWRTRITAAIGVLAAMDARLDEHVKRMDETRGNDRIAAMAAALDGLAAEHRTLRERVGSMPGCGTGGGHR